MLAYPGVKRFRENEDDIEQLDAEAETDVKIANDAIAPGVEDTLSQVLVCICQIIMLRNCLVTSIVTQVIVV